MQDFKSILDNSERESDTGVAKAGGRKILVIVDSLASYLSFEDTRVIFMVQNEGYAHLVLKIKQQIFSVKGYKLVILLIGRGDVWETDKIYFDGVEQALKTIHNQNENCIVVLGTTLPSTLDSKPMSVLLHSEMIN